MRAINIPSDAHPTYVQLAHHPTNPVQHGYNTAGSVLSHVNLCVTGTGLGNAVSMYKNAHSIMSIGTNDSCMAALHVWTKVRLDACRTSLLETSSGSSGVLVSIWIWYAAVNRKLCKQQKSNAQRKVGQAIETRLQTSTTNHHTRLRVPSTHHMNLHKA